MNTEAGQIDFQNTVRLTQYQNNDKMTTNIK